MDLPPIPDDDPAPAPEHPDHPQWLRRRIGVWLKHRRKMLGKTAMGLAKEHQGEITDQTILNNEAGKRNTGILTLGRHCQILGSSLPEVIQEVTRLLAAAVETDIPNLFG